MTQTQERIRIIYDLDYSCKELEPLDSGGQGDVKICRKPITFVVKESHNEKDLKGELKYYMDREIRKKYTYVLQMFPLFIDDDPSNLIDPRRIAMPHMDMTLSKFIKGTYTFAQRLEMMRSLIVVVKGLHNENHYNHNDLKPANIGVNVLKTKDGNKQMVSFDVKQGHV